MRRACESLIILVLLSIPLLAAAADRTGDLEWYPLIGPGEESPALLSVLNAPEGELRARLLVPGLLAGTGPTKGGPRSFLEIPGGGLTAGPGGPRLPVLRYLVEIPPGAELSLSLTAADRRTLSLGELGLEAPLAPVQLPVPKIAGAREAAAFLEERSLYERDALWPAEAVALVDRAVLRGRSLALVEVRPVRYNPALGILEVWSRAELRVAWEGGDPADALRRRTRLKSSALDAALDSLVTGAGPPSGEGATAGSAGGAAEGAEGLLVVVHDDFLGALQPLVDWKRQTGFKVEVVKTSSLGPSPTDADVKAAVQSRYDTWSDPALGFLLLVGDTDFTPIHQGSGGGNSQVTDNWYACLEGTDYLPEIAVARISTRTAAETTEVVDKLLTYERATFATDDWTKTVGFIGTSDSGHIGLIEGTHDWCIDTYYTPNGFLHTAWSHGGASSDRHYYTYDADTSEISASIDEGRTLVNYSGHGSTTSWQGPTSHGGYDQTDVRGNTNADMYPFVISNACVTGSLQVTECFGETWQKGAERGSIAFWGASNNSYWDEDDYLQRSLHGNVFPVDATPPIGVIVNETKIDLYEHYGDTGTTAYYFDMYNLLSEPTLSLWTRRPRTPVVSYPESLPIGENLLEVTVTFEGSPVEGALVAARREEDGVFESGYTDAAGAVTLTLDPAPASVGPMGVTVTGHDLRPHEGSTNVISPDSPWLVHRSHGVDDAAGGDGDGLANPGETFVMPVTVENVGQQPGTGLSATLGTSTPQWVEILDAAADFPDLAVDQQGESLPDHYRVRVTEAASDGVLLGFDLHWSADGGASGTTSFGETVVAVDFAYEDHAVDDAVGGNGNGVAGPGETVDMTVTVANAGHRDASTVHGVLTTGSPYITLLQDQADFPDLAQGQSGESQPPPFRFEVASNAPDRQPVTFELALAEAGGYSEVLSFDVMISSCSVVASSDVPRSILDNTTVESTLDYPAGIDIGEVNVFVDIKHTYQGDLKVTVLSPIGTSVLLHNRTGGSTDDIITWYDTETEPAEPLSTLNGENSQGTWILRVEDLAGGDEGLLEAWSLEVCGSASAPAPSLTMDDHSMDDAGACDPDGFADVGETVTYRVSVRNAGSAPATGVQASLSSPDLVAVLNNPVDLPDLGPGQSAAADFLVLIGAVGCQEPADYNLSLTCNEGSWGGGFGDVLEVDEGLLVTAEDVEHGGAEPAGWSHSAAVGTDTWRVDSSRNHGAGGQWSWFAVDPNKALDDRLATPDHDILAGGASTLEFWHWEELEPLTSGGVVEISADGGSSWTDLGAQLTEGVYDQALAGDGPLAGRQAWVGHSGGWRRSVADLSPWAGQTVRFRFRLGADSKKPGTGWWIDDVTVSTEGRTCDGQACGIPGEVEGVLVAETVDSVVVSWLADVVAREYRVWRSDDPSQASSFQDASSEDPDTTDTTFTCRAAGSFLSYLVTSVGPDGEGDWGHFGQ